MSGGLWDFVFKFLKGLLLGKCVLALMYYMEVWWTRYEQRKLLLQKKSILDQMEKEQIKKLEKKKKEEIERKKLKEKEEKEAAETEN